MPEDRYEWLDEEAAERLLRGLPVNGQDEPGAGTSARALADALDALVAESVGAAAGQPAGEPLTGEDAAVAAFRAAQAGVLRSGSVGSAVVARPARSGGLRAFMSALTGRPVGAGLAAAIAACALGGVAVAASTGVLPTPFGDGGGTPSPVVSTSSATSPGSTGGGHGDGHGRGRNDPTAGPTGGEQPSGTPGGDTSSGEGSGRGPDDVLGNLPGGSGLTGAQKKALALALCDAYERRELGAADRRKLEEAAGGPGEVRTFCEQLGGGKADEGVVGDGGTGGAGSGGGDDGSATEGGDGSENGDGTVGGQVGGSTSGTIGGVGGGDGGAVTEGGDGGAKTGGADGGTGDGGEGGATVPSTSPVPTSTPSATSVPGSDPAGGLGDMAP